MANIPGTNVASTIAPFTTDDQFPTHDAKYGKGGQREVATIAERDAIPLARLTEGCTCYVAATEKTYRWKNNAWVDDTPEIPDSVTSVITNNELVFKTPNGQSVKGKIGVTTGADGLLHLTLTDEQGHTYSSPIAGLRVVGNALQYSNDGETWVTVQTFGRLAIKYAQASDPASGDEGDLALVGTTNAYVLKVYAGGSWVSVGDIGSLDLTSDGITMVGENKTLTQKMEEMPDNVQGSAGSDLDIADEAGSVLARFSEGHLKTKNFDSRDVEKIKQNTGLSEYDEFDVESDYAVGDIVLHEGLLYKFTSAHTAGAWDDSEVEQTNIVAELDVEHPVDTMDGTNADLDIADDIGRVALRLQNGHIKTKNFDSSAALVSKWKGKKIVWNGHSGIYGNYVNEVNIFPYLICTTLGATYRNYAIGGSTLAKIPNSYDKMFLSEEDWQEAVENNEVDTTKRYLVKDTVNGVNRVERPFCMYSYSGDSWNKDSNRSSDHIYRTPLVDRITEMDTDADLVIIGIGGNDWFHAKDSDWVRMGEPYENGALNSDKESVCGAMNLVCQYLSETYLQNGKRVLFVTECPSFPYYTGNNNNINSPYSEKMGMTYREFFTTLMEIAANYGIPYWDLESEVGLSSYDNWWVSRTDLSVNRKSHPNEAGHARVAEILGRKLLTF